jgi:hypothetical protein
LKRIFLWEGFPGHPLRKDYLALPGGYKPGLQRFPYEFPEGQRTYPNLLADTPTQAPAVPRLDQPPEHPFPIEEPPPAARPSDPTGTEAALSRGVGADPSLAGGTAVDPGDTLDRAHAGPGAEADRADAQGAPGEASSGGDEPEATA